LVEVWTSDEHRVGLQPIVRKVWAPVGVKPTITVEQRYEWMWLYAFVNPESGNTYWLILPTVTALLFSQALAEFAEYNHIGREKQVILVLDQAGFHTGGEVQVPEGIHIMWLPSHSPELQPAERLWELTDETVVNIRFDTIADMEENQVRRCQQLRQMKDIIRSRTLFHWWPIVSLC
jgi:transposase